MRAMLPVMTRLSVRLRVMEPRGLPLGWADVRRWARAGKCFRASAGVVNRAFETKATQSSVDEMGVT